MSDNTINRRDFLKSAAAAVGRTRVSLYRPPACAGQGQTPPSDKLNIAGIGVGGMGASNLRELEIGEYRRPLRRRPELRRRDHQATTRAPSSTPTTA